MKKLIALCLTALISLSTFAQKEPFLVKTFSGSSLKNVQVNTSGGSIEVTGNSSGKTIVEVFITGNNGLKTLSNSEIEDRLKDYTLDVRKEGNTLVCEAKSTKQNNWKSGLNISFKVQTPQDINTDLLTSGGSIKMSNLNGNLNFKTSGGSLNLTNLSGNVLGRTSGGSITGTNMEDHIDLSTSGGSITVKSSEGKIKLNTSGGGITLAQMSGLIDAHTSGGSIKASDIHGELITGTSGGSIRLEKMTASIKASTSGGSINAEILEVGKFLVLHTSAGGINVNMPMNKGMNLDIKGERVTMAYKNFDGSFDKNHVHGTINGGGANVEISANSGNVNIN